jgi:hypothetical protein
MFSRVHLAHSATILLVIPYHYALIRPSIHHYSYVLLVYTYTDASLRSQYCSDSKQMQILPLLFTRHAKYFVGKHITSGDMTMSYNDAASLLVKTLAVLINVAHHGIDINCGCLLDCGHHVCIYVCVCMAAHR